MFFKRKDVIGNALLDYLNGNQSAKLILYNHMKINNMYIATGKDRIRVADFYKEIDNLMEVDRQVLNQCYGKVLDIGAGAGSHSLILMKKGIDVYSLDISPGAVEVMKRRGLKKVYCNDIKKFKGTQFDTLAFFGNNHGLFGSIEELEVFFLNITDLLKPNGQILIASPYIKIPISNYYIEYCNQYIELNMKLEYKGIVGKNFKWFMVEPGYLMSYFKKYKWTIETTYYYQEKTCLIRLTNLHNRGDVFHLKRSNGY